MEGNTHPLFGELAAADGPAELTQEEPIGAVDLDALSAEELALMWLDSKEADSPIQPTD
jgi:hypothetical protein